MCVLNTAARISNLNMCVSLFIQGKDRSMSALQGLLQDLSAELQDERTEFESAPKAAQSKAAEVRAVFTLQA